MTKYNVHIYREMRLYFPGIEADSPQAAAEIASRKESGDADDVEDCNGEDFGALVDVEGDPDYDNSELIDFEPQLKLRRADELLTFAARIARLTQDSEEIDGREFVMENDDAVATLNSLIDEARRIVAGAEGRQA